MPTPHDSRCPIRLGEPCSLCYPGATGPADCGLVYLVRNDPDLWAERGRMLTQRRARSSRAAR